MTEQPFISVIIPIRNEAAFIEQSLGAVLSQDYPPEKVEILIADGMSDDGTPAIIQRMPGADRVRIIPNPRRIQSAGLNLLIPEARGEVIVRIDGHTIIEPDYLRQCVETLTATGADNVGGAMDPVGSTPMGQAIAIAGKSPFAVPTAFHTHSTAHDTDTVYLGAWPRRVFDRVGLYNETVGVNEDYELNYRIRASGGRVYFNPAIKSRYYGRQTLQALARQYYRYGISKVKMLQQHPGSVKPRQLAAPALVAWLAAGSVTAPFSKWLRILWLLGLLAYGSVNLLFTVKTILKIGQWSLLWRLPIIFAVIHIAWGAGFWKALSNPTQPL